jgi:hypothetical protein
MTTAKYLEELEKVQAKYFSSNGRGSMGSPIEVAMIPNNANIPPWYSTARDKRLYDIMIESNHLAGLAYTALTKLANIPLQFLPRDRTITSHVNRGQEFSMMIRGLSEGGEGLRVSMKRFILDYLVTDNGGFMEVMGEGPSDGPIKGAPWGLKHLNSLDCRRTGDPKYPVSYLNPEDGKRYKLFFSRVIYMCQQPMGLTRKNGVGLGSISRSHLLGEILNGQILYKLEKMGRRPGTKLFVGDGISAEQMISSFMAANSLQDNLGLQHFGMNVYIGGNAVSVRSEDLNNFDPFDEETGTLMAMYAIAYAWGLKIQDIWPVQGSRSNDQISNMQSRGRLPIDFINDLQEQMEFKLCPPYIEPVFFEQDDEQEMMQANITDIRSRSVSRTAEHGILDVPAQRRLMLENNEISRAEFVRQQLDDGFLEDGSPVAVLFYSEDTVIKKLLKFEGDPLMFEENDPQETIARIHVQMIECYKIMNEPSEARKRKAGEALAALEWLKGQYQHMIMEVEPDESDETEEEEPEPERSNGQVQEEVPVA